MLQTVISSMITVGVIRNGANYLSHHLRENDYWTEGEKEVNGEWIPDVASCRMRGDRSLKIAQVAQQKSPPEQMGGLIIGCRGWI